MIEILLGIAGVAWYLSWRRTSDNRKTIERLSADVARLHMAVDHLTEALAAKSREMPEGNDGSARVSPWAKTGNMRADTAAAEAVTSAPSLPSVPDDGSNRDEGTGVAASTAPVPGMPEPSGKAEPTGETVSVEAAYARQTPESMPLPVRDAEQTFATRWATWIGGIALAFGGLLIVRYSIEMGYFGPGMRLFMGATFSVALALASEFIRRRDLRFAALKMPTEHVPAILAGVSVLSGFGVIYAAYALYGFIGASTAVGMMGALGLAALATSLVHGPYFGLFGLAGSYFTPLLVSGAAPNFLALSVFIAVVTTAAFLIERLRPSALLLGGAICGHAIWTVLTALTAADGIWAAFLLTIMTLVATARLEAGTFSALASPSARAEARHAEPLDLAAFAVPLVIGGFLWVEQGGGPAFRVALVMLVMGCLAAAIRHRGYALLAPLAGAAATGIILLWPDSGGAMRVTPVILLEIFQLDLPANAAAGLVPFALGLSALVMVPTFVSLLRGWRNGGGPDFDRGALAFASALSGVCILLAASLRLNGFERTPAFAMIAAGLMGVLACASELLFRRERRISADPASTMEPGPLALVGSAAYAAGAAIALGLAVAFALRETWLVVGFALASGGVALVQRYRPVPLLRSMAASLGMAALARILWAPILSDVGDWPVLNWLAVVYGGPALIFGCGALCLANRRDRALGVLEGLCAFFLTSYLLLAVVQAFFGTDLLQVAAVLIDGPRGPSLGVTTGVFSIGGLMVALLAFLFAWLGRLSGSPTFARAGKIAAIGLVPIAVGGLACLANPLILNRPAFEPMIVNSFLFGHTGLAIALLLLARMAGPNGVVTPMVKRIAGFLGLVGIALLVRHAFHGPTLMSGEFMTLAEAGLYGSMALLLAFGISWRHQHADLQILVALGSVALWGLAWLAAGGGHAPLVGWFLVNNAAVGLALPAILAALLSWWTYGRGPASLDARVYGISAVIGGLIFVLQQVRWLFPGSDWLGQFAVSGDPTRLFGYSLAMIGYGVALLIAGLRFAHRDLRLAALAVIVLAAFKVFLLDLAGLEGLWRAMSFIGLGGSLMGIAYLYRWLMPPERSTVATTSRV